MSKDQNNRELGLIDILQIMGHWCVNGVKKAVHGALYLFFFGIKQWKILGAILLALVIFSYVQYKGQETQYEASLMLRSNAVHASQMKSFLESYNNLLHNKVMDEKEVDDKTGLDAASRAQLNSLMVYQCIDENRDGIMDDVDWGDKLKASDERMDSLNLCLKVRFNDISVLDKLMPSIQHYLAQVPYVQKMNEVRLAQQAKRRDFILNEIRLLDTMQQKSYGEANVASDMIRRGAVLVDNRDMLNLYEDKVTLWSWYENLQKEITYFKDPTTLVEDFTIQQSPINTLASVMKKNVVLGFIIAYVLLLLVIAIWKQKDQYLSQL